MLGMHSYEIEIKSLLGSPDNAKRLKKRMSEVDTGTKLLSQNKQLNHYFVGGDMKSFYKEVHALFPKGQQKKLKKIIEVGEDFSVRTRQKDDQVLLVVKASIDDTTSENGISRIEFEEKVDISLDELDKKILASGFEYQAKWSREREEYKCKGVNVCLDKNAGYGYLAEFERVVDDADMKDEVQNELRDLMCELGAEELLQDRLQRMFDFYNANWVDYYGTDKIFVVE
jgi:predicted adenylyl cyclase CyaB